MPPRTETVRRVKQVVQPAQQQGVGAQTPDHKAGGAPSPAPGGAPAAAHPEGQVAARHPQTPATEAQDARGPQAFVSPEPGAAQAAAAAAGQARSAAASPDVSRAAAAGAPAQTSPTHAQLVPAGTGPAPTPLQTPLRALSELHASPAAALSASPGWTPHPEGGLATKESKSAPLATEVASRTPDARLYRAMRFTRLEDDEQSASPAGLSFRDAQSPAGVGESVTVEALLPRRVIIAPPPPEWWPYLEAQFPWLAGGAPPASTPAARGPSSASASSSSSSSSPSSSSSSAAAVPLEPAPAPVQAAPPPARGLDGGRADDKVGQARATFDAALRWRALRDMPMGGRLREALFKQLEGYGHGSPEDLQALENLVQWIRTGLPDAALAAAAPDAPQVAVEERATQVIALSRVLHSRLADFLRQSEAPRFARVLAFLAQRGISAQRLNEAMGSARFHDGLRQLVTSEFGYMSSFGVFNGLMALLLHQFGGASQRLSPATASIPLFAAPLTAMFTNRQLRQREVMPKWTRPVEAGPDGKARHHAQTDSGAWKVGTQYWGFVGSLGYAAWDPRGPMQRVLDRLYGGFFATAFVALHRLVTLNVDYPWLAAETPDQRRALLGTLRTLAPSAEDGGVHVPPAGTAADRMLAEAPPQSLAGYAEELGWSAKRTLCFFIPLALTFTFFAPILEDASEAMTSERRLELGLAATAGAAVLLSLWGPAMWAQERFASLDPSIARESKARAARNQFLMAQTVAPEAPAAPAAAAPEPAAAAVPRLPAAAQPPAAGPQVAVVAQPAAPGPIATEAAPQGREPDRVQVHVVSARGASRAGSESHRSKASPASAERKSRRSDEPT